MRRLMMGLLAAGVAPAATLESDRLRVAFDDVRGAMTSFVDRETGREFVRGAGAGLYELTFWDAARARVRLTEREARASVVVRGRTVVVTSTHEERKITVRVECRLAGAALACGIGVKNGSPLALQAVRFPAVEFPVRLGESAEDDRVLLPKCDGAVLENPEANLQGGAVSNYPGTASVQLLAFYDATAGIRVTALDGGGHRKAMGFNRRGAGLGLHMVHYPAVAAGQDFTLPYAVEMAVFHGDWETAAAEYRRWAVKQKWCRKRLDERIGELPEWLRGMPFFYTMSARGLTAENQTALRYDMIAEQAEGYAKLLRSPVCAMVMSWEKHGPWVAPDYFPAWGGDAAFQTLMARLRAAGNRSLFFLSGLKWTLRKGAAFDATEAFAREGEAAAIVGEDGKTLVVGKPDQDTGQYGELCPATRYAQDLLSRVSRRATELGVTAVQVDQMVGGGSPACYSERHAHPAGGGHWQADAVYSLFARLRAEGKQRSKEFAFLIEEPGEFFIPVLDAYHARDYAEGRWPRDGRGIRGVPLFTFIYHDYLLGYGGDSAGISAGVSAQNVYSAAANLVNGKVAAAAVWGRYQPPERVERGQRELLAAALAMARGPAREFLLYGQRMPAPRLDVAEVRIPVWVQATGKGEDRVHPAVVQGLWRLRGGRLGWVAVNVSGKAVEVTSPLGDGERVKLEAGAAVFRGRRAR
jgi:hypothetical protein